MIVARCSAMALRTTTSLKRGITIRVDPTIMAAFMTQLP